MRQISVSTLSNQDISTALLVCTYIADADRGLFFRLFLDQIAGSGDYFVYCTIQRLGAGNEYRVIPSTIVAVPAVTSATLQTVVIPVKALDVIKIYVLGLPADDTIPDIITEVWEDDATLNSVWTNAKAAYLDGYISDVQTLGAGAINWEVNVNVGADPLDGVDVWVSTDIGGTNVIAHGSTDDNGKVMFMLDAGIYYAWKQLAGYSFTNPETMVVA
jgi:hypothetical protein